MRHNHGLTLAPDWRPAWPFGLLFTALVATAAALALKGAAAPPEPKSASWSVAAAEAQPPAELAPAVRAVLATKSLQVASGEELLLEIWLRASTPAQATLEQIENGLTWREFAPGTLLAAVRVHHPFTDYRRQEWNPQVYTLRLARQPLQDEHLGTAPHPEFALAVAAGDDPNPAPLDDRTLFRKSADAIDSNHPATLLLWPLTRPPASPALVTPEPGHKALATALAVVAADRQVTVGLRLNLLGHSPKAPE
ncbi:MAG TPA: hypothetical protein PKC45_11895 [Gemmatales bacterium]|nr:hypothetical protein [Gemmatales bacterium]